METKQQRIERLKRELAEAKAMPDAPRSMCFVPKAYDSYSAPRCNTAGEGWIDERFNRLELYGGSYREPLLHPEYAPNFVKAMNQIFQFKGAEGCVPADELEDGFEYWYLNYRGELDYWMYEDGLADSACFLIGNFTSEALLLAARDRICGGAEGAVEMMRNFHGVKGE